MTLPPIKVAVALAFSTLALQISCFADYAGTVRAQSPVGYWRLNETASPISSDRVRNAGTLGQTADGACEGLPSRGVAGPFAESVAIGFDGIQQRVMTPYGAALNPTQFSIEAWLNPATTQPEENLACVMSSLHNDSPRSGWLVYQAGSWSVFDSPAPGFELRMYAQDAKNTSLRLLITNNVTPGTWYHIVFTFDGAVARAYLNGEYTGQAQAVGFVPNVDGPLALGARSDRNFPQWSGKMAEFAMYGSVLSGEQVKAHFTAATQNSAGYLSLIQDDAPLVYYDFKGAVEPIASNLGTFGSNADGRYVYSVSAGQPGPRPPESKGFEEGNLAAGFDGVGGTVSIPALNLANNPMTITAWVRPNGMQAAGPLVMNRTGSTEGGLILSAQGALGYDWAGDSGESSWSSGLSVPDAQWSFVALGVASNSASMYLGSAVDGSFSAAQNSRPHALQLFEGPTLIGADGTNHFKGEIDEVAIFNRSLTAGEIYTAFAAGVGNLAPRVFSSPESATVYPGEKLVLQVDAGGTPALAYQWRKKGEAIEGATNNFFTIATMTGEEVGAYDVVVTNEFGSAQSQEASVNLNDQVPPTIVADPQERRLYRTGTLRLSVDAAGGSLQYQWSKDGLAVAGATNATFTVPSVDISDQGVYQVAVSNALGSATSKPAAVTVLLPKEGSYSAAIVEDAPEAWWRMDDAAGSGTMADAMGRHDGRYVLGAEGAVNFHVPGALLEESNPAVAFGGLNGYGEVPYSAALNAAEFAIECWVRTSVLDNPTMSPVSTRSDRGIWLWSYPMGRWGGGVTQQGADYFFASGLTDDSIHGGEWTHLVATYSAGSSLRLFVNGETGSTGAPDFLRNSSGSLLVGARGGATAPDMFFSGAVDEVAVYQHALSPTQIQHHYLARFGAKPFFLRQPGATASVVGGQITLEAQVVGAVPLTYQWSKDGTAIPGATNAVFMISAARYTDAGIYTLAATNAGGQTLSEPVSFSVLPPLQFANATNGLVLHLAFDGNYEDSSGRGNNGTPVGNPTFMPGKVGQALRYVTFAENGVVKEANYVTLGKPVDLSFSSNVSFSVSYWVQLPAGYLAGDLPFLCSSVTSYSRPGLTFAPSYQYGGWSWSLGYGQTNYAGLYGADESINDGNWHHLLHVFDRASGQGITYLDGTRVDVTSIVDVGDVDSGFSFSIGQDPTGAYPETGSAQLDDLGVWRRALTPADAYAVWYAAEHFGNSFDTYGPVQLLLVSDGAEQLLVWQAGTLLQADNIAGPWTPVPGAAAPNFKLAPTAAQKFFRVQL